MVSSRRSTSSQPSSSSSPWGGLSNQEKAKQAIWYAIVGMGLAVVATMFGGAGHFWLLIPMVAIGGVGGWYAASRVKMTEMPELVAGFHSLVGLAAVLIGLNAHLEAARVGRVLALGLPERLIGFGATLAQKTPVELNIMRVEIFLGILIGAVTFTGSIVAYLKLAGKNRLQAADPAEPARHQHRRRRDLPHPWHRLLHGRRAVVDASSSP